MDELKLKTPMMRRLVGKAVTKYLRSKGIDLDMSIRDVDGSTDPNGNLKIRADVEIELTKAQVIKLLD